MNEPVPQTPAPQAQERIRLASLLALGLVVCVVAISNHSYWLDETESVYKATLPSLADWWNHLRIEGSGNLQLPFYHFFAWAWEKVVGTNEFLMRFGNAPWFLAGAALLAFAMGGSVSSGGAGMFVAILCSPFAWYYLNEARPYAVQISLASAVLASVYRLGKSGDEKGERRWVVAFCLGLVLLSASGLLAMLWAVAYLAAAVLSTARERLLRLARLYAGEWAVTLVLLAGVWCFYLWTLMIGARATAVGTTDFRNVLFIPYELLGFSGLGPGRGTIRAGGGDLSAFLPWTPWLGIYGFALLGVLWPAWRELRGKLPQRAMVSWGCMFLLVAAFIFGVGVAVRFRVLGRHFAPVLPVVLFVVASGLTSLIKQGGSKRAMFVAFVGLSLASCLSLRFANRHAKDDYRGAAALGKEALARGQSVWWNADGEGALLYRLPVAESAGVAGSAFYLANPLENFGSKVSLPDLVLVSKPDIYDRGGFLQQYLEGNGFRRAETLTGFTAWRRAGR